MGGFGSLITSGLQLGLQLAGQRQAASQLRQEADAAEAASNVQAARLRERYARDSKKLAQEQLQAASLARVQAAKHGAQGDSQAAVAAARAAQDQEARNDLYLDTAATMGDQGIAAGQRAAQLRSQARQRELEYNRTLLAGLGNMPALGLPTLHGGNGGAR